MNARGWCARDEDVTTLDELIVLRPTGEYLGSACQLQRPVGHEDNPVLRYRPVDERHA